MRLPPLQNGAFIMRALMYVGPEKVEVQDIPLPALQPSQVLLKISATGICGSDIHGFLGHSERRKPGLILGHETIATIEEVHASVTAWKPGQRVIVNPLMTCGACAACTGGKQNLCANWRVLGLDRVHGTYAEFTALPTTS